MKKILLGLGFATLVATNALAGTIETPFTILVGEPSWLAESQSIARALDHESTLRVMPVVGAGSVQAVQDLQQFSLINAALITADSAAYVRAQNIGDVDGDKISYVTAIKPLPVLLVARKGINNITALAGKKVATGPADSASFATGELLFGALGVPFTRVAQAQEKALDALVQGKADAALVLGTPLNLERLNGANFHLLPLVVPQELADTYQPAKLSAHEAPGLVSAGQQVETVSTQLILAVNETSTSADQRKILKTFEAELFKQLGPSLGNPTQDNVPGLAREANAAQLAKSLAPITIIPTGAKP